MNTHTHIHTHTHTLTCSHHIHSLQDKQTVFTLNWASNKLILRPGLVCSSTLSAVIRSMGDMVVLPQYTHCSTAWWRNMYCSCQCMNVWMDDKKYHHYQSYDILASVCIIFILCCLSLFTIDTRSTLCSLFTCSTAMHRPMNTAVLPIPALEIWENMQVK